MTKPSTTSIANYYGSARTNAEAPGKLLGKLDFCLIPFCGGCCEIPHIQTRTGNASDLHRHLVNCIRCVRDPAMKDELVRRLEATLYHPDELANAQSRCRTQEEAVKENLFRNRSEVWKIGADIDWAYDYLVSSWMGRGGKSGTDGEFDQGMSIRWGASGGDSCRRFRSMTESLDAWCKIFQPWTFIVMDCFESIDELVNAQHATKTTQRWGCYCDAPSWPGAVDSYVHKFTDAMHAKLRDLILELRDTRIVIRYGDHPKIRELYPQTKWKYVAQASRAQSGKELSELLISNF